MVTQRRKGNGMSDNSIKYAVYYLADSGKTTEEITSELKTTKKKVESILLTRPAQKTKEIGAKDLMITQTSQKKTKNVAIMTEAASMMIDSKKNSLTSQTKHDRMSETTIYRPLDNQ